MQETDGTHQRGVQEAVIPAQDGLGQQRSGNTGVNVDVKLEMSRQCAPTRKRAFQVILGHTPARPELQEVQVRESLRPMIANRNVAVDE